MAWSVSKSPGRYFWVLLGRTFGNARKRGVDLVVTLGGELVGAVVAVYEGGAISFDWSKFHWFPAVASFVSISALVFVYHYLRAQWELHREAEVEITRLSGEVKMLTPERPTIWVDEVNVLVVQDSEHVKGSNQSNYRDSLQVIVKNPRDLRISVWAPLWENSTGDVLAFSPTTSELHVPVLAQDGTVAGWQGPSQSSEITCNQVIRCQIALLEPNGDGFKRRLQNTNTGTLVIPMKIESRLAIQKIKV